MGPLQPAEGPGNKQVSFLLCHAIARASNSVNVIFQATLPSLPVIHLHGHDRSTNNECCKIPNCFLLFLRRQPQGTLLFPGQVRKQKLTQESVEVTQQPCV